MQRIHDRYTANSSMYPSDIQICGMREYTQKCRVITRRKVQHAI